MNNTIIRRSVASLLGGAAAAGIAFAAGPVASAQGAAGAPTMAQSDPTCTKYPLQYTHWYGRNDGTVRSHSGVNSADRPTIMRIQRTLNTMDSKPGLAVDGYFGPATEEATKKLQRHLNQYGAGLVVDGMFGKRTFFAAADAGWWRTLCG